MEGQTDRQTDTQTDRQTDLSRSAEDTCDLVELIDFTQAWKQRLKSIQLRHYTTHRPDVNRRTVAS